MANSIVFPIITLAGITVIPIVAIAIIVVVPFIIAVLISAPPLVLHGLADEVTASCTDSRTDQRLVTAPVQQPANRRSCGGTGQRTFTRRIASGKYKGS